MAKLLKHRLPSCSVLSHLCLDEQTLIELQSCMMVLKNEFISVFDVNKELCGIHHSLASQVYDNFFQIALTDSEAVNNAPDISCEKIDHCRGRGHRRDAQRAGLAKPGGQCVGAVPAWPV